MANNNYSNKSYIVSINSNFRVENGQRTIRIFTNDGRYHDIIIPTDSGSSSKKNSASQVSIASNGNWEIDGKDTGQKSQGEKGESGTNGTNGKTWRPSVDENGNLTWSENDSD